MNLNQRQRRPWHMAILHQAAARKKLFVAQIGTINLDAKDEWKTSVGGDRRLFFPHAAAGFGAVLRGLVGRCPAAKKAA